MQRDPIGIRGGANVYAYVGNSPLTKLDPSGFFPWYVDMGAVVACAFMGPSIGIAVGVQYTLLDNLDEIEAFFNGPVQSVGEAVLDAGQVPLDVLTDVVNNPGGFLRTIWLIHGRIPLDRFGEDLSGALEFADDWFMDVGPVP